MTNNNYCPNTVNPTDYQALNVSVAFQPCDSQHCVSVSIINDLINEPEEKFSIILSSSGDGIAITVANGEVTIMDDDGNNVNFMDYNYYITMVAIVLENKTLYHLTIDYLYSNHYFADKPEAVMFHVVNATAVRLTWSGSVHLFTCIQYTIICSDTRIITGQYERVFPPEVTYTVWVLDDDVIFMDAYIHKFTLYYFISDISLPISPDTVATYTFGKSLANIFCSNSLLCR